MLQEKREDQLEVAVDALIKYFCENPEIIPQTKEILLRLRLDFGGATPSLFQPKQTLAYLWARKYDNAQLGSIDYALFRLDCRNQPSPQNPTNQGLEALKIILELFNKSRSQNWSAGTVLALTQLTSPSLNNQLGCDLLKRAGFNTSDIDMANMLATWGALFCKLLQEAVEAKEIELAQMSQLRLQREAANISRIDSAETLRAPANEWSWNPTLDDVAPEPILRLRSRQSTTPIKEMVKFSMTF